MSWLEKIFPDKIRAEPHSAKRKSVPDGLWSKCPSCQATLYGPELKKNQYVCLQCSHHLRINVELRIKQLFDHGKATKFNESITPNDILNFKDTKSYKERLKVANAKTPETEALTTVHGKLKNIPIVMAIFEYAFIGGSMGSVVGERFIRAVDYCLANNLPLVCITASGGARMQESLFSLMQMSKTAAALNKMKQRALPYIVVLTDPTTGGVSASLAMLGDIHLAEPRALICFAGPRVIEQTVREVLPEGFQRSEFLLEKGMIDQVVDRRELRDTLGSLLSKLLNINPTAEAPKPHHDAK